MSQPHDGALDTLASLRQQLDKNGDAVARTPRPSPEDYWASLQPVLKRFGISRIGDVTGLDRIGIPVVQAFRPAAKSNVVNQGKGTTMALAALSATMEALETWAAERLPRDRLRRATARDLLPEGDLRALEQIVLAEDRVDWRGTARDWVAGWDIASDRQVWLPAAMVATDYTRSAPYRTEPFARSTTGLAAASSALDAVRHGLAESVERQSTTRAMAIHGFFQRHRLAADTITCDRLAGLLDRVRAAGLLVGFWHCPSPPGWSVVWSRLLEASDSPDQLPLPADGFAASPCMHHAAEKALLEAVQTRVSVIAGGREDITRRAYPRFPDRQLLMADRRLLSDEGGTRFPTAANGEMKLSAGSRPDGAPIPVVAVPLYAQAAPDIHVVRTVVLGSAQ